MKVGRKATWDERIVNDLVDIITDDEKLKKKLLLTNVKNVKNSEYYKEVISELKVRCEGRGTTFNYSITQTRDKYKRCVCLYKDATLKANSAYMTGVNEPDSLLRSPPKCCNAVIHA